MSDKKYWTFSWHSNFWDVPVPPGNTGWSNFHPRPFRSLWHTPTLHTSLYYISFSLFLSLYRSFPSFATLLISTTSFENIFRSQTLQISSGKGVYSDILFRQSLEGEMKHLIIYVVQKSYLLCCCLWCMSLKGSLRVFLFILIFSQLCLFIM